MIVDQRMLDIIRKLHSELPVLSYDELLEAKKLIMSPDEDTRSIGLSMLYFSNFFERPMCINWLLRQVSIDKLNDDGKTLRQLLLYIADSSEKDEKIYKKLMENDTI